MKKIKYTGNNGRQISSSDVPKHELRKDETMLLQVIISQDDSKSTFQRNSVGILDLLGDVGGVMGLLTMLTAKFGTYFSANFFSAAVANKMYIQKVKKPQDKETPQHKVTLQEYLDDNFSKIQFSTLQILLDPLITSFFCFKRCSCCHSWRRVKLLQESDSRFNDELNIRKMLEKIRTSTDLQQEFSQQNEEYLKYNKSRVIILQD